MARIIDFVRRRRDGATGATAQGGPRPDILSGFSLEVTPATAAKVARFDDLLPAGTRVYIAHIEGVSLDAMVATARRLTEEGMTPMPHFPARVIPDAATLRLMTARYRDEAGVTQALMVGGAARRPAGAFASVADMAATGAFDAAGFIRLHVAGHPEGNADLDPDGGERVAMQALLWKQAMARRTGAQMAIATQFCFDAAPVIAWSRRLAQAGVDLPIHVGVAGPAKLQTLIKYAMACGVGPSLDVLRRRAADLSNLILPFSPDAVLDGLSVHRRAEPDGLIAGVHFFPFGGVARLAEFVSAQQGAVSRSQRA
jgi:methylenetetrahydrofolate reductase (NADPH)